MAADTCWRGAHSGGVGCLPKLSHDIKGTRWRVHELEAISIPSLLCSLQHPYLILDLLLTSFSFYLGQRQAQTLIIKWNPNDTLGTLYFSPEMLVLRCVWRRKQPAEMVWHPGGSFGNCLSLIFPRLQINPNYSLGGLVSASGLQHVGPSWDYHSVPFGPSHHSLFISAFTTVLDPGTQLRKPASLFSLLEGWICICASSPPKGVPMLFSWSRSSPLTG